MKSIIAVGIDVSKEKLDVSFYDGKNHIIKVYSNKEDGIAKLINDAEAIKKKVGQINKNQGDKKQVDKNQEDKNREDKNHLYDCELHFIMEATGSYHTKVLFELSNKDYTVYLLNPLISKRYSEEQLRRTTTDKVASKLLAEYAYSSISSYLLGIQNERYNILISSKFDSREKDELDLKILLKTLEGLKKTRTRILNQIEALNQYPKGYGIDASKSLNNVLKEIDKEIKEIENKISGILNNGEKRDLYERLKTIPGIGDRSASVIIAYFGSFSTFESPKQVPCYTGLTPLIKQSGKSVGAKEIYHISKIGSPYIRQVMYMAALSAARYNKQCNILYNRLLNKGKSKKLIYVAISCKLLRQAFGIIKNGTVYDPDFGLILDEENKRNNNKEGLRCTASC